MTGAPDGHGHFPAHRMGAIAAHYPAGISTWIFAQQFRNGQVNRFQHFDYLDPEVNMRVYGQPTPPKYDYKNVTSTNFAVYYSRTDNLSPEDHTAPFEFDVPGKKSCDRDVILKYALAGGFLEFFATPLEWNYTHLDFTYGDTVGEQIYRRVLRLLRNVK